MSRIENTDDLGVKVELVRVGKNGNPTVSLIQLSLHPRQNFTWVSADGSQCWSIVSNFNDKQKGYEPFELGIFTAGSDGFLHGVYKKYNIDDNSFTVRRMRLDPSLLASDDGSRLHDDMADNVLFVDESLESK